MPGSLALAESHYFYVVPCEELQEEGICGSEDDITFGLLQLTKVGIVNSHIRMIISAVFQRVEQTDGSKNCLTDSMRIIAHK